MDAVMKITSDATQDPIELFRQWFADAEAAEPEYPNAMTLATADAEGRPSARMVLLKGLDDRGFVFYTNLTSRKGRELAENPHAALVFYWKSLTRQVRIEGAIESVSGEDADAYFASRPRLSQIGAWASKQSTPLEGRFELEKRVAKYTAKFNVGAIPRPEFWSGFRLVPARIEFWKEEAFRLHDRSLYTRADDGGWQMEKLFP
jgi:pyridoxamine 5'-phosphate oxidase